MSDSDSKSGQSREHCEEDLLTSLEEEVQPTLNYHEFQATMRRVTEISDEQEARGNTRFVQRFIESNSSNQILVEEIQPLKNRHTMPLTSTRRRYPASIYYN